MLYRLCGFFCLLVRQNVASRFPVGVPGKTLFVHSALQIANISGKGEGLIVTKNVSLGEVLLVELPWITKSETPHLSDSYFELMDNISSGMNGKIAQQIWNELACNEKTKDEAAMNMIQCSKSTGVAARARDAARNEIDLRNEMKMMTNSISYKLYAIASKMNHGYPTTVAVFVDKTRDRLSVMATDDLSAGTELVWDYLGFAVQSQAAEDINSICDRHGIDLLHGPPFNDGSWGVLPNRLTQRDVEYLRDGFHGHGEWDTLYRNGFAPYFAVQILYFQEHGIAVHFRQSMGSMMHSARSLSAEKQERLKKIVFSYRDFSVDLIRFRQYWMGKEFNEAMDLWDVQ